MKTQIKFKCVEVTQPIGTFYIGAANSEDILAIAYADVRRINERDIEKIMGIQRELNPKRVKELNQYARNVDATFPTSVILAISSKHARFDADTSVMTIDSDEQVAKIIDGQHRIAGLEGISGFQLNVTIFIDMDVDDQALTFATINITQTKVSKSLVYDLYAYQKTRSPQKTCHTVARLLNREESSPFKGRIKILGKAIGQSDFEFLTQAAFVEQLIGYISSDPMADRDTIKRGKSPEPAFGAERQRLVFRDLFLSGHDSVIADIVWTYFDRIAARWPDAWNSTERGYVLNRTQGFAGLMRALGPIYRTSAESSGRLSPVKLDNLLKRVALDDKDFTIERYPPGSSGQAAITRDVLENIDTTQSKLF